MTNVSMKQLLACALLVTALLATSVVSAAGVTMRADLTHVDSGRGFTKWELVTRMAARSRARATSLHHRGNHGGGNHGGGGGGGGGGNHGGGGGGNHGLFVTAPASPGPVVHRSTEYLIHFGIGTPHPQQVALTLDTGSDLVWTQCLPCPDCFDQPFPYFDYRASKTILPVSCYDPICKESIISACYLRSQVCFYLDSYGDRSVTAGQIVRDILTFKDSSGSTVVRQYLYFGCGLYDVGVFSSNESGIAGFGRGAQSLPSQLKVEGFSHCFTSMFEPGKSSPVFLGAVADLRRAPVTGPGQSTPMPRYRNGAPTFYYLSFKGITVGSTRLPIDESVFAIKSDGTGGTVIDSGTSVTTFPQAVHDKITTAFSAQLRLPVHTDDSGFTCFTLPKGADEKKVAVPKLVFHLEGADMDLPLENYMYFENGTMCLIMAGGEGVDPSLIGNFQQQNMHIIYDLKNEKLHFAPAKCDDKL